MDVEVLAVEHRIATLAGLDGCSVLLPTPSPGSMKTMLPPRPPAGLRLLCAGLVSPRVLQEDGAVFIHQGSEHNLGLQAHNGQTLRQAFDTTCAGQGTAARAPSKAVRSMIQGCGGRSTLGLRSKLQQVPGQTVSPGFRAEIMNKVGWADSC